MLLHSSFLFSLYSIIKIIFSLAVDLFFHQDIFSYVFHITSWNIIQVLIPTGPNWSLFKPSLLIINCSEPQSKVHNCLPGDSLSLKLLSPYHPRWSQLTDISRLCIKSLQGFGLIGTSFPLLSLWELLKGFGLTLCTILGIHTHTHTHTHTHVVYLIWMMLKETDQLLKIATLITCWCKRKRKFSILSLKTQILFKGTEYMVLWNKSPSQSSCSSRLASSNLLV